ncbi:MAG: hypothetical protein ABH835_03515 [Patescibacteria group bacterium]|nr:hypothetical protein [Patescibacteria group bacterium]
MTEKLFQPRPANQDASRNRTTNTEQEATEQDIEALRQCVAELKETGNKFDNALCQYQELLRAQENIELTIEQLEQAGANEQEVTRLKAKATKLMWASMRYLTSGAMIGTAAGATTYTFTKDPGLTALVGAGGALAGAVIENKLRTAEIKADRSKQYYRGHPETKAFMEKKDREAEAQANETERLNEAYKNIQARIAEIETEIDDLGRSGFASLELTREEEMPQADNKEAIKAIAEKLQQLSMEFDQLLVEYFTLTKVVEEAEQNFQNQKLYHDFRNLQVTVNVLSRKAFELARRFNMTFAVGGMLGIGAGMLAAIKGYDPVSAGVAGASAGAAFNEFFFERWERNIVYNNVPKHTLDHRYRTAMDLELQRFKDPQLQMDKELMEQARINRDSLLEEQARLNDELEEFVRRYPMKK